VDGISKSYVNLFHNWRFLVFIHLFFPWSVFPVEPIYYLGIYGIAGFDPTAYHLGSLIIHVVNSILVYRLIFGLSSIISDQSNTNRKVGFALASALIFAIHPLQVESVAWISASKVLLYTTFTLLGMLSYLRYKNHAKYRYLLLTFLCYVGSLLVKEQAIIFPLNIILLDLLYHAYGQGSIRVRVWLEKIPFFVLAFAYWYWSAQNQVGVLEPSITYPWYDRLIFGSHSLIVYMIRFFAPVNLLYFYGIPIVVGESIPWIYYGYFVLAMFFLAYLIDLFRRKKYVPFFGLLFFVINILLVLHIIPMPRTMIMADRYMYLSVVGISVWAIWLIHKLIQVYSNVSWIKIGVGVGLGIFIVGFMIYSNVLTRKWKDSDRIKKDVREYFEQSYGETKTK